MPREGPWEVLLKPYDLKYKGSVVKLRSLPLMSVQVDHPKLSVGQFAERFRGDLIPLSTTFSYYCASVPLSPEDMKEYLEEPIGALPPSVAAVLPKISIMLVPYLERVNEKGRAKGGEFVCTEKPPKGRLFWASQVRLEKDKAEVLLFALKDQEVAEYHYRFYQMLSALLASRWEPSARREYSQLLREELTSAVHGEVDEESWHLKQSLQRRPINSVAREGKLFREYVVQSFIDTMTLYLHGICCDIDVDTGPRQLASRHLRKRLSLLHRTYPQPEGYAVFPEDLKA